MSTSQNPNTGDTPSTGTGSGTGTGTGTSTNISTDPTPQGSYWRAYGSHQPQAWARPGKLLCDCPAHSVWQWPTEHAELTIAPCAYRCPFCDEFNKAARPRLMASNLRRHITKTHIEGNPEWFGTLVVAAGVLRNRGNIPRSADGKYHLGVPQPQL